MGIQARQQPELLSHHIVTDAQKCNSHHKYSVHEQTHMQHESQNWRMYDRTHV